MFAGGKGRAGEGGLLLKTKPASGEAAVRQLLHEYGERNRNGILELLTDDVIWIGTAAHEQIFGKHAVARLLDDDLRTDATPYDVELTDVKEIALGPAVAALFVQTRASLRGRTDFALECRNTYTCCDKGDGFRICSWHCSTATALQNEDEYFPISFAENIMKKATLDPVTRIMNRASFEESVQLYLKERRGNYALALIDLDDFKGVNDRYGHHCGDKVLAFVAQRLKRAFAETDLVARLGGDELVAFVPSLTGEEELRAKIEAFFSGISRALTLDSQVYMPSASVGVCICREKRGMSYEQCYKAADAAMYQAKHSGKNAWRFKRF